MTERRRAHKDILEIQLGDDERELMERTILLLGGGCNLDKIEHRLAIIIGLLEHLQPDADDEPDVYFHQARINGIVIGGRIEMAELREGQRIPLSVAFKTVNGRPAVYEVGSATWTTTGPEAAFEADPDDETKGYLVGVDGSNNISGTAEFRADGDPDADQVRQLIATLAYTVTQGEAHVAEITAGAAEDNPAIPTPGPPPEEEPTAPVDEAPPVPSEPAPEETTET